MTAILNNPLLQAVSPLVRNALTDTTAETSTEDTGNTEAQTTNATDFETQLRALLSPQEGNQISEEDLFAAVIQSQLEKLKGSTVAEDYATQLQSHKNDLRRGDGYVNVEKAAKMALADMVDVGHLTETERQEVYGQSFAAAQLDSNTEALYDGRGGPGDSTVATADMESALASAQLAIQALEAGTLDAAVDNGAADTGSVNTPDATTSSTPGSSNVTPTGNDVDGQGGFVFKPEGEHDKKLVILLPEQMTGDVAKVLLKDENGDTIEEGRGSGVANNNREHFRFNRAGQDYENNITVEVTLDNGETIEYQIPNPGERYD